MFIFVGEEIKTVIPENRIYQIKLVRNTIIIDYDGGEITYLQDYNSESVAPKIETIKVEYASNEVANDVLRSFYVACDKKAGAFYF